MEYLWTKDVQPPRFAALNGDITTDVLVIGGGMAGVLCARMLTDAGADCVLAEAKRVGNGITKGTTAVVTAQHDTLYTDLIKKFGEERAKLYLEANLSAVDSFSTLSQRFPCDFEHRPSLMYSRQDNKALLREAQAVQGLGFPAEFITQVPLPLPVKIAGAVRYPDMAQIHPLKFLYGAAQELRIYENTFIRRLEGTTAYSDTGRISAKKVVIATHFPFINSHGLYFMKLYQQRSFIVALENAPELGCTMVETADGGMYFRNYNGLLLVGGGDRRTGAKGGGFEAVREFARACFPESRERYAWATQDCMSLDGVPYIGRYSSGMPGVYVAAGFNEWGMTSSMVAARLLTDMICGRENRFAPVFAPDRSMISAQLFANLGATLGNFAIPTAKRCPHMGCALKWNAAENSWDCSCHGSRFDHSGRLIDNPAMKDSRVK